MPLLRRRSFRPSIAGSCRSDWVSTRRRGGRAAPAEGERAARSASVASSIDFARPFSTSTSAARAGSVGSRSKSAAISSTRTTWWQKIEITAAGMPR
jgi:hypothetical protein